MAKLLRYLKPIWWEVLIVMLLTALDAYLGLLLPDFMYLNIFQQPFEDLGQIYSSIQSMGAAAERIYVVLDETQEKADDPDCLASEEAVQGDVVFDHDQGFVVVHKNSFKNHSTARNENVTFRGFPTKKRQDSTSWMFGKCCLSLRANLQ